MADEENTPHAQDTPETLTISASEPADAWTLKTLKGTDHGWHGFACQSCLGRYATLTCAFDAGYQFGIDQALSMMTPRASDGRSAIPIIGSQAGGER